MVSGTNLVLVTVFPASEESSILHHFIATVQSIQVNIQALEATSALGGDGLIPFYGLLEGGKEGELFAELEDHFYYSQMRSQGVDSMER